MVLYASQARHPKLDRFARHSNSETCRLQQRNAYEYLIGVMKAKFAGETAPSLLPLLEVVGNLTRRWGSMVLPLTPPFVEWRKVKLLKFAVADPLRRCNGLLRVVTDRHLEPL
jgi:hypothetical protein